MIVKPGDLWVCEFTTASFATGAATDATGTPAATLYVNGVANAATVTVSNIATGLYKASVTIPALNAGDTVAMVVTATVAGVVGAGVVAQATVDTQRGADVASTLTAIKGVGWTDETLVSIQAAAEGAGGGTGARSVVVTVTDGADPLEGATVRLTLSGVSYVLATDTSGEAAFSLDDGTYALAVSLAGWAFTPTTTAVNGDEAIAVTMTQVVIPAPTEPDTCVVYTYARDIHGTAQASAPVLFRLEAVDGLAGAAFDGDTLTATSAADGLVQVQLPQGAKASVYDRGARWRQFDVPAADSYELPAVIV